MPLSSLSSSKRLMRARAPVSEVGSCDLMPKPATLIVVPSNPRTAGVAAEEVDGSVMATPASTHTDANHETTLRTTSPLWSYDVTHGTSPDQDHLLRALRLFRPRRARGSGTP